MKLTITREPLLATLDAPAALIDGKSPIAILTNVKIAAAADRLEIVGNNLSMMARSSAPCDASEIGELCVSGDRLKSFVGRTPKGATIALETKGSTLSVTSGRSRASLQTMSAADYPAMMFAGGVELSINSHVLGEMVDFVSAHFDPKADRFYLAGILLRARDGVAEMVATDGHSAGAGARPGSRA